MNTFEFLLNRLARQRIPMGVGGAFQLCEVSAHYSIIGIGESIFIPLALPLMKILVDLPHIVKQVTNADCVRLFP